MKLMYVGIGVRTKRHLRVIFKVIFERARAVDYYNAVD